MTTDTSVPVPTEEAPRPFILYLDEPHYSVEIRKLVTWVHQLLLPVYGREVSPGSPWCPRWWLHPEAVAQLHGLWLAWQGQTAAAAGMAGPAIWHRDFLGPVMASLRDPSGPFVGCKVGGHRPKAAPVIDKFSTHYR